MTRPAGCRSDTTRSSSPPAAAPSFRRSRTCATSTACSSRACSCFARSTTASASCAARRPRARAAVIGGGLAGARSGPRPSQLGPRDARRPPDAASDGDAARRRRGAMCFGASSSRWACVTHLETRTTAVLGNGHVDGPRVRGRRLRSSAISWSIAAGIRPNAKLAVDAGLDVNRGIVVGDDLGCLCRRRAAPACLPSASAPSIAAACTGWSRRCGSRRRGSPIGSAAAIPTPSISGRRCRPSSR